MKLTLPTPEQQMNGVLGVLEDGTAIHGSLEYIPTEHLGKAVFQIKWYDEIAWRDVEYVDYAKMQARFAELQEEQRDACRRFSNVPGLTLRVLFQTALVAKLPCNKRT